MMTTTTGGFHLWALGLAAAVALSVPALAAAQEPPGGFVIHEAPKPVPELRFEDGRGRTASLAAFRGRTVLLNIWATWCNPCRREMPTLDRLQAALGGPDFEVVALSIDRGGAEPVRRFYDEIGIEHLALYLDRQANVMGALGVVGLPTTLLIDSEGREVGRLIGPAEWDTPEMIVFFRSRLPSKASAVDRQRSP